LDEPFVNGLGRMCHEDATLEVGLRKHVGQRGGMIDVETSQMSVCWTAARRLLTRPVEARKW
jgi:hypothetical protein